MSPETLLTQGHGGPHLGPTKLRLGEPHGLNPLPGLVHDGVDPRFEALHPTLARRHGEGRGVRHIQTGHLSAKPRSDGEALGGAHRGRRRRPQRPRGDWRRRSTAAHAAFGRWARRRRRAGGAR